MPAPAPTEAFRLHQGGLQCTLSNFYLLHHCKMHSTSMYFNQLFPTGMHFTHQNPYICAHDTRQGVLIRLVCTNCIVDCICHVYIWIHRCNVLCPYTSHLYMCTWHQKLNIYSEVADSVSKIATNFNLAAPVQCQRPSATLCIFLRWCTVYCSNSKLCTYMEEEMV